MTDSRELAHVENMPMRQSENLLQQVIAAAKDPTVDAAKMEALVRLVNSQQDRDREIEFNQSKNAAIMEMPVITKDGRIVIKDKDTGRERQQGRFARFEDIDRVVRPILQRHNLAMGFDTEERQGGGILVRPILTHTNGFTERGGGMPLPADQSGGKNAVQAVGSSIQYGKRYTMCAMLNIQTEGVDDDGNGGRGTTVTLPFEREQVVLADATAAFEQGRYLEWYAQQSPKDRGWLVSSRKHEEFGGQVAIAPPSKASTSAAATPASTPPPPPPPPPPAPDKPMTARQWLAKFKADVVACQKVDDLDLYMDEARESLDKLKGSSPAMWQEAQDAYQERKTAFAEGRLV